jgi:selenium metabolism protein YedF
MEARLDCRGLACPAPVLQTKELIERESPEQIRITVDNEAARQNVSRFLGTQQYEVTADAEGGLFHVLGRRGGTASNEPAPAPSPGADAKKIVVMVAADRMGRGDDELGKKLMISFLTTLKEMGDELWRLVFVNNGVKLTVAESDVLPILKELEQGGVAILVCGTCLTHFRLIDKKQVGETTNMLDIVTAMQLADKVITI